MQANQLQVWDPFVRIFHWSLVTAFAVAYVAEDSLTVHAWAGYAIALLIPARVLWGFVGSAHARFADFVYRPSVVLSYARDFVRMRSRRYLGHTPGGGAMILLLLAALSATVVTGLLLYGLSEGGGPLGFLSAPAAGGVRHETPFVEGLEEAHELLANISLALVAVHVVAVFLASRMHRENLVRSMISGRKKSVT